MHLWISKNRILDIQKLNGIKDIHNSIYGYHKYIFGYPIFNMIFGYPIMYLRISLNSADFRISIIRFLDIHNSI